MVGYKRYVNLSEELNYGSHSLKRYYAYPYIDLGLEPNQNPIVEQESYRREPTLEMFGGFVGTGPLVMLGRPEPLGWLLKWALGTVAAGEVQDAEVFYKHRYTVGDSIKSFTLDDTRIGTGTDASRFTYGNVIKTLTLEATMRAPLLMTADLQYNWEKLQDGGGVTPTEPVPRAFHLADAYVALGVAGSEAPVKVESMRLIIENTIPDDAHISNSRKLPDISLEASDIRVELGLRFEDWSQRNLFYGGTGTEVEPQDEVKIVRFDARFVGPATGLTINTKHKFDIYLNQCMMTENPAPVSRRDRLQQDVTLRSRFAPTSRIDLYNAFPDYETPV